MTEQSWVQQPPPQLGGCVWESELSSLAQLPILRAGLRHRLPHSESFDVAEEFHLRALLALEELASNGLRYGRAPVQVRVIIGGGCLLIEVSDADPQQAPAPAMDRDPAHGGLGLHLIAALTAAHGWYVRHNRKHVWAYCHQAPIPPRGQPS